MQSGRYFIMRHGETVYNASARLQANHIHTPLTRLGFEQASAMGHALRDLLGDRPRVTLHVSDTGRALQTAALICEALDIEWFDARRSSALREIDMGSWCERTYAEIEAEHGPVVLAEHLLRPAPDGEDYPAIARRLAAWRDALGDPGGDHIVVMHGISSRVLRGMMGGYPVHADHGVPIAPSLVQGSIALVENGRESVLFGASRGVEHA